MIFPNLSARRFIGTGVLFPLLFSSSASQAQAPAAAPATADSITVAIAPEYNRAGGTHRIFFGDNYRRLWATPVRLRVLRLAQEKGGLTITERGGGQQTKSLQLRDSAGREWVLRSVQKNPEKALPPNLRPTVAKDILQDLISTSHPYGALAVSPLAEALGLRHPHPEIIYLPDDPALGEYRKDFAGTALLLEEREPLDGADTDNTEKVLNRLKENPGTRIDQRLVLRARLLDMVIGDWDRHDDQWRWIEDSSATGKTYQPFPRDRDQVFYNADGLFPFIVSRKWLLPKFQGFRKKVRDINGFNFNARYFDRSFLNSLGQSDWEQEIALVQSRLTDEVLDRAVGRLPPPIRALSGPAILEKLKARRDHLATEGLRYFRFLSRTVDIAGSDEKEFFQVVPEASGALTVAAYTGPGQTGTPLYRRVFYPHLTHEVRLYGRGGADLFSVAGGGRSPITVRLIGGDGPDSFRTEPGFRHPKRLYLYDRSDQPNSYPSRARFRLSADSAVNAYDRKEFRYHQLVPRAYIGYNLDDGLLLGAGFAAERHSFRKEPFASRHRLLLGHSAATSAFFGAYRGLWKQLSGGKLDLSIDLDARAPNNTSNFFGLGNETVFVREGKQPILYYRTRYNLITTEMKLLRPVGRKGQVSAGLAGQYYSNRPGRNEGRFINVYHQQRPEEAVFSEKYYGGFVAGAEWDSRNSNWWPSRGVLGNLQLTGLRQLNGHRDPYGQARLEFAFYLSPARDTSIILANRIGGGTTLGQPAFFQYLYLGGNANLRGFRNYRFAGKSMLYHNLELRVKLLDFTSYLFPGSAGISLFNDLGRVWLPGESSATWHDGYGGGLYLIPARLVLVQAAAGFSKEGVLPYVSIGFRF
ncbi:BamA/TamA family outer membrane protein [Paraflavisolibacter sp. H34]|uniref:BamA/TamA family outer membrane protein n=1 Tax=Huijunlia imazamoxiresistens TaxID=3127457 RepID=UPI00301933B9